METLLTIDLLIPEKTKLAAFIQNELTTDFEEATVEWVDCPDLTQEPFNLATPGLCGDTALLDIGGISNLFPSPQKDKLFKYTDILQKLNRTQSNNLIIGGGFCLRDSCCKQDLINELIMNASYSSEANKIINKSSYVQTSDCTENEDKKFLVKPLLNRYLNCVLCGNFFISKGLREQVFKIHVKNRTGRDFIDALQHAIKRFLCKTSSQLIGFGGTFIVKNGTTVYHVIRHDYDWTNPIKTRKKIRNCFEYGKVQSPTVAFATFVNADRHIDHMNSGLKEIFLTRMHAHAYSDNGGGYYHGTELNNCDVTEYLGYFSPATKLHRIDPVPMFYEMPDFFYLQNH